MKLDYIKNGDFFVPNLILKNNNTSSLGKYGLLKLNYIKQNKKTLYQDLLSKNNLTTYLIHIDKTATERVEMIVNSLAEKVGVTEQSKAKDQMKWLGLMNNFNSQAEEIVLNELIYD